jgi:Protein of unknown function (DUF3145)
MERLSSPAARSSVQGFLTIHSAPSALRRHIDWALQNILGTNMQVAWHSQPLLPGTFKSAISWRDAEGKAAEIASTLRSWHYLNFEVHERNDNGGELFRFTPELGIHRALTDLSGAVLLNENQVSEVLRNAFDEDAIRQAIAQILGNAWDAELERFRGAGMQEISHLRAI